jgi:hypothetical protein
VKKNNKVFYTDNNKEIEIDEDSIVSMNFWGFTPRFFEQLDRDFRKFIVENANQLKAEFFIPLVVNNLIKSKEATIKVLKSTAQWFGVTYQEDKPVTIQKVKQLVEQGVYPENLWK